MNPYHHALSSARQYGGRWEDYLALHQWFDESKAFHPDFRHRALRHHAEGIFLAERIFGPTLINSAGRRVPTRFLGEQHVKEDLGRIPTVQDWLECLTPRPWMLKAGVTSSDVESDGGPCACEQPGHFNCGVPGILAHLVGDRVEPGATVERCDQCQRYPSDAAALAKLHQLGIA